jgi:nucleotide-binding universal stress UspA family protein
LISIKASLAEVLQGSLFRSPLMGEPIMSMRITNILCATDGSPHSDAAVAFASEFAAATAATLTIAAVRPYALGRGGPVPLWDAAKAKAALERAKDIARKAGTKEIHLTEADAPDVADAIVTLADREAVDHIVVGSSGKGTLKRAMVGSVSSNVVHKAHCPVTVVQRPTVKKTATESAFKVAPNIA